MVRCLGAAVLGCLAAVGAEASTTSVDAGRGPVTVRVPEFGSGPRPLILQLHGYSSNASDTENFLFQLGSRAEAAGILLAMPEGTIDGLGHRFWNATDACCDFFGTGVDDVGYLLALIDQIDEELGGVDREHIYLVGHSNGGFMSYRMACEHAESFAAVVSFAGATFEDETDCAPSRPVPVLQIHVIADNTLPYGGGTFPPPAPPVVLPGAIETVEDWAAYDGCDPSEHEVGAPFDGRNDVAGITDTAVRRYQVGCGGPHAELWSIDDDPDGNADTHFPLDVTNQLRDRLFAWLLAAGSLVHRDGFETGDGTVWDRSDPQIPIPPP